MYMKFDRHRKYEFTVIKIIFIVYFGKEVTLLSYNYILL